MNCIIKTESNSSSSLFQLYSCIKLRLNDEAKYLRLQEFHNTNSITEMLLVSNIIFKLIDKICKKYLTLNLLVLQRKQIVEALLYRTWIKETSNIEMQQVNTLESENFENL